MTRARISAKAESFTESVIREMNRLAVEAGAVSLAQGFPDFAVPARAQGRRRGARSTTTSTSTRSPGARSRCATRSRRRPSRHFPGWDADRPRDAGHRHLRRDRGDDRGDARRCSTRATRSSSSSPTTRTTGPDAILSGAVPALRHAPRAGLVDRPRRAAGGLRAADPGDRRQLAAQPDGQGVHAATSSS